MNRRVGGTRGGMQWSWSVADRCSRCGEWRLANGAAAGFASIRDARTLPALMGGGQLLGQNRSVDLAI